MRSIKAVISIEIISKEALFKTQSFSKNNFTKLSWNFFYIEYKKSSNSLAGLEHSYRFVEQVYPYPYAKQVKLTFG